MFSHYQNIIRIKLQNPEIARAPSKIVETEIGNVAGFITEYDGSTLMVVHNLGEEERTVEIPKDDFNYSGIRTQLTALDPTGEDGQGTPYIRRQSSTGRH